MRRAPLLVLSVVALTGACGIPLDDGPRAIPAESAPAIEPGADAAEGVGFFASVYLVNGEDLVERETRALGVDPTLFAVLTSLLEGPTAEERDEGLRSAIPDPSQLIEVSPPTDRMVVVDLTGGPLPSGEPGRLAVAQIVNTATEPGLGVDRVSLRVDGEPLQVPDAEGALSTEPLTRDAFADVTT